MALIKPFSGKPALSVGTRWKVFSYQAITKSFDPVALKAKWVAGTSSHPEVCFPDFRRISYLLGLSFRLDYAFVHDIDIVC